MIADVQLKKGVSAPAVNKEGSKLILQEMVFMYFLGVVPLYFLKVFIK